MFRRLGLASLLVFLLALSFPTQAQGEPLYSFENDPQGWTLVSAWEAGQRLETSTEMASEGVSALKLTASYTGEGWQEAGAMVQPAADWSSYAMLSVDVYAPVDGFIAQIYFKTGDSWVWSNTPDTLLTSGAWTTVPADLALVAASDVREVGVKIGANTTAFDGAFYIDNVVLSAETPTSGESVTSTVRAVTSVTALSDTVGLYEKFEAVIALDADYNNPYDPLDIRLDAEFTSPSGITVTAPGFYYRDFTTGIDSWRVRFTPAEAGEWTYQVRAAAANSTESSELFTFTVTESDRHGFLRVDSRNPRYLAFDDGTPYFAVGENMSWYGSGGMADYQQWLDSLAAADGNFIRVWMASWGFGVEWIDTGLGNYDLRQDRAYQLDQLFEMAEERDIYIMLCLLNHGAFSVTTDSEWDANPYNVANGGPLQNPLEFATNPEAVRLWQQRLRYIAARWGYSTHLMAWEWWNEVNWTPIADPAVLASWVSESAALLDTLDPYDHLITTSGSQASDDTVWTQMDFVQEHMYNMRSLKRDFAVTILEWAGRYPDQPVLIGEFGSPVEYDTEGMLLHLGLWSAPMNGAFGTGMTWWWDTLVHPLNWYPHIAGVAAFFADEDMGARQWHSTEIVLDEEANADIYGLQTDDYALLWIVNKDYSERYLTRQYESNLRDEIENPSRIEFSTIENATLILHGLADGDYTLEWWDTLSGTVLSSESVTVSAGEGVTVTPAFDRDLAIKIYPVS